MVSSSPFGFPNAQPTAMKYNTGINPFPSMSDMGSEIERFNPALMANPNSSSGYEVSMKEPVVPTRSFYSAPKLFQARTEPSPSLYAQPTIPYYP